MKRRKLVLPKVLHELTEKVTAGIPLTVAIRQLSLDLTPPTACKLVEYYLDSKADGKLTESIFPPWLNPNGAKVQEQPAEWVYKGYFPLGEWQCRQ